MRQPKAVRSQKICFLGLIKVIGNKSYVHSFVSNKWDWNVNATSRLALTHCIPIILTPFNARWTLNWLEFKFSPHSNDFHPTLIWPLSIQLNVSKFQKQIFLLSFEPKIEWFFKFLPKGSKMGQIKKLMPIIWNTP